MNSITQLLNLEDSDIFISDISIQGTSKTLTLETKLYAHYCPSCGYRMHSRGIKKRTIKHPILQDGYELILLLKQRRWMCSLLQHTETSWKHPFLSLIGFMFLTHMLMRCLIAM